MADFLAAFLRAVDVRLSELCTHDVTVLWVVIVIVVVNHSQRVDVVGIANSVSCIVLVTAVNIAYCIQLSRVYVATYSEIYNGIEVVAAISA